MNEILSASRVAHIMGWSRTTAWRWLKSLDRTFTVRRGAKGKWIGITRENLEALARNARAPVDERIERRLADLERRLADSERRTDGLARDVVSLRRAVG